MSTEVILPKLGLTMENATITNWLVKEGDTVQQGSPLVEIETDKIVQQIEAPVSGKVAKILVPDGSENIDVGTVICVIE
ncbi:MAG: hypothetical protein HPY45_03815 [Anaerolineae bacterium]|nr:hypothetical protein [Anaerolineae bacterium]